MSRSKWLGAGALAIVVMGIAGWYHSRQELTSRSNWKRPPIAKNDGEAEMSDVIEPLWVERGRIEAVPAVHVIDEPMARVVLEPGMVQPPRPDADPGKALRMPYADEEEILPRVVDPVTRLLEVTRPIVGFFEELNREEQQQR